MKANFIKLLLLSTLIISCKKVIFRDDGDKFSLSVSNDEDAPALQWNKVNSEDFVRYDVFRSSVSIPNPEIGQAVSGTRIFSTSDKEIVTFKDSLSIANGKNYYKVFAVLKQRQIPSNEITSISSNFSMLGSATLMVNDYEGKKVYFYLQNTSQYIGYLDYANDSLVSASSINSINFNSVAIGKRNGQDFAFASNNFSNIIYALDAKTFDLNSTLSNLSESIRWVAYGKQKLYALASNINPKIFQIDPETGNVENTYSLPSLSFNTIEITKNGNALLAYSTSGLQKFIINPDGSLTADASNTSPNYNIDFGSNSYSPNGQFVGINSSGTILGSDLNILGNVPGLGLSNLVIEYGFSPNEQFVYCLIDVSQGGDKLQVYKISDMSLVKSSKLNLQNSGFDGNSVFEYNNIIYVIYNSFDPLTFQNIIVVKKIKKDF